MRKTVIGVIVTFALMFFSMISYADNIWSDIWRNYDPEKATNVAQLSMINAPKAWDLFNTYYEAHKQELKPVKVGLVDTSVYTEHEDLRFAGTYMNPNGDNLRRAYEDWINTINSVHSITDKSTKELYNGKKTVYEHGTHVAGIIGAITGNHRGIRGMYPLATEVGGIGDNPEYKSNLYAACTIGWTATGAEKNLSRTARYYEKNYKYLFDNGVKVINMSMGYGDISEEEGRSLGRFFQNELDHGHDFIIITSAGNEGMDAQDHADLAQILYDEFPSVYKRIIVVGNTQTDYILADEQLTDDFGVDHTSSNYGMRVDITAPGENIESTMPDGGYAELSGTSMAAPFVTGTAAMMWTLDPAATGADIKNMLLATAPLAVTRYNVDDRTYPLLDAYKAVKLATQHAAIDHISDLTFVTDEKANEEYTFEDFIRDVLVPMYGTIPQYTLYMSEDRSDRELGGMINAHCDDFDSDGADELLVSRFHHKQDGAGDDELFLTMEVYEKNGDEISLQDSMTLLVPGIAEVQGLYASEIAAFLYREDGDLRIAFDTYYGSNESSVTVAIYSYDGQDFVFEGDFCHEAYGSGNILVRHAKSEPSGRHTLSGVEWRMLEEDVDEPWETLYCYDSETHNWEMPSTEVEVFLAQEFQEVLASKGLIMNEDCRVFQKPLPEDASVEEFEDQYNQRFFLDLSYAYGDSDSFEMLWQIVSFQPLGGDLMLERADYGSLLEPYYMGNEPRSGHESDSTEIDETEANTSSLMELRPGMKITFGSYAPYGGMEGTIWEPVTWRVLDTDDNRALLLSDKVLEARPLDNRSDAYTYPYADLQMRTWRLQDIYKLAFTDEERTHILTTNVDNGEDPDTEDPLFLLSVDEVLYYLPEEEDRIAYGTDSARIRGLLQEDEEQRSYWWLRTRGTGDIGLYAAVRPNGRIDEDGQAYSYRFYGIRPAMWVTLMEDGMHLVEDKDEYDLYNGQEDETKEDYGEYDGSWYDDSESALINRVMAEYNGEGGLLTYGYADYDGNGHRELFALMGVYNEETFENMAELWYACGDSAMRVERAGGCYPGNSYIAAHDGHVCFRVSEGYFGSGVAERFWSADDEMPFLLDGTYMVENLNELN